MTPGPVAFHPVDRPTLRAGLLMALALAGAAILAPRAAAADVSDRIVAVVNKEVIMLSELRT